MADKIKTKSTCQQDGHVDYVHPEGKYAYCTTCRKNKAKAQKRKIVLAQRRAERRASKETAPTTTSRLLKAIIYLVKDDESLQREVMAFIVGDR